MECNDINSIWYFSTWCIKNPFHPNNIPYYMKRIDGILAGNVYLITDVKYIYISIFSAATKQKFPSFSSKECVFIYDALYIIVSGSGRKVNCAIKPLVSWRKSRVSYGTFVQRAKNPVGVFPIYNLGFFCFYFTIRKNIWNALAVTGRRREKVRVRIYAVKDRIMDRVSI